MLLSYVLNRYLRRHDAMSTLELRAVKFKGILFLINLISFALAGLCFLRHNTHCEPGGKCANRLLNCKFMDLCLSVYSLFALFEYVVVLTNMGFHMTAYWDFSGQNLAFDSGNGFYLTAI